MENPPQYAVSVLTIVVQLFKYRPVTVDKIKESIYKNISIKHVRIYIG